MRKVPSVILLNRTRAGPPSHLEVRSVKPAHAAHTTHVILERHRQSLRVFDPSHAVCIASTTGHAETLLTCSSDRRVGTPEAGCSRSTDAPGATIYSACVPSGWNATRFQRRLVTVAVGEGSKPCNRALPLPSDGPVIPNLKLHQGSFLARGRTLENLTSRQTSIVLSPNLLQPDLGSG